MAVGDYTKTTYVNGTAPAISAQNLNNNETKTDELDSALASHSADYTTLLASLADQKFLTLRGVRYIG